MRAAMWEKVKIKGTKHYKSHPEEIKPDRITVEVDMPIELYSDFRRQVEVPLHNKKRRDSDQESKQKKAHQNK